MGDILYELNFANVKFCDTLRKMLKSTKSAKFEFFQYSKENLPVLINPLNSVSSTKI